jgi:hypothetical protein
MQVKHGIQGTQARTTQAIGIASQASKARLGWGAAGRGHSGRQGTQWAQAGDTVGATQRLVPAILASLLGGTTNGT